MLHIETLQGLETGAEQESARLLREGFLDKVLSRSDYGDSQEYDERQAPRDYVSAAPLDNGHSTSDQSQPGSPDAVPANQVPTQQTSVRDGSGVTPSEDTSSLPEKLQKANFLCYTPKTSEMILEVVPHGAKDIASIYANRTQVERAKTTIYSLLQEYTNVQPDETKESTESFDNITALSVVRDVPRSDDSGRKESEIWDEQTDHGATEQSKTSSYRQQHGVDDRRTGPEHSSERDLQRSRTYHHQRPDAPYYYPPNVKPANYALPQFFPPYYQSPSLHAQGLSYHQAPYTTVPQALFHTPAGTMPSSYVHPCEQTRPCHGGHNSQLQCQHCVSHAKPSAAPPAGASACSACHNLEGICLSPTPLLGNPWRDDRHEHLQDSQISTKTILLLEEIAGNLATSRKEALHLQMHCTKFEQELHVEREKERLKQDAMETYKCQSEENTSIIAAEEQEKLVKLKTGHGKSFCIPIEACKNWQVGLGSHDDPVRIS